MKKEGYRPATIEGAVRYLKRVAKHADIMNPEQVKAHIASASWSESHKERVCDDLARFYRFSNIPFEQPRYRKVLRLPFIPLEREVDELISGVAGKKTSCFLRLLKETGMRAGEAWALKWIDVDFEQATVNVQPEKNSNLRVLRISTRLLAILNTLNKDSNWIFRTKNPNPLGSLDNFRTTFERQRRAVAEKLAEKLDLIDVEPHPLRLPQIQVSIHTNGDVIMTARMSGSK
jgi:integrase